MITFNSHIRYWKTSAQRDWHTANDLFTTKHFSPCLFFCHLALEKTLKGLVVQNTKTAAPYTHDLGLLAKLAGLALSESQENFLRTINTFNLSARYDDVKLQFHKKATPLFTEKYLRETEKLFLWLQKKY